MLDRKQKDTVSIIKPKRNAGDSQMAIEKSRKLIDINRKSIKVYETILNNVSEGILAINSDGTIMSLNKIGGHILHIEPKEVIGKHVSEIFGFKPPVLEVLKTGKGFENKEFIINTRRGKVQLVKSAIPIINEEGTVEVVINLFWETRSYNLQPTKPSHQARFTFDDIIGTSEEMKKVKNQAMIAARNSANIIITGESGTGKELLAHAIHNCSARAQGPFVAINCGAIPRELIESELFGYDSGAFTGARQGGRIGKFELASKGTIFLDEVGEMPLDMQVRLLRVLQDKQIDRIGGERVIDVDFRVIAATNKDLNIEISKGNFRSDLFWRLNVINIHIPPLSYRKEDVNSLIDFFISRYSEQHANEYQIDKKARDILIKYDWPGNVREVENTIERAVNYCNSYIIMPEHLPKHILSKSSKAGRLPNSFSIKEAEKEIIYEVIKQCDGNITKASRMLEMSRNTLYSKMIKYRIPKDISKTNSVNS